MVNQCDGCRRGLPVTNGVHRGQGGFWAGDMQSCTADRYGPDESIELTSNSPRSAMGGDSLGEGR
jgi:hypothetical protein